MQRLDKRGTEVRTDNKLTRSLGLIPPALWAAVCVHAERDAPAASAWPYSDRIVTEYN